MKDWMMVCDPDELVQIKADDLKDIDSIKKKVDDDDIDSINNIISTNNEGSSSSLHGDFHVNSTGVQIHLLISYQIYKSSIKFIAYLLNLINCLLNFFCYISY